MQISVPLDNDLLDDIINQRHVDNDVNNLFYIFFDTRYALTLSPQFCPHLLYNYKLYIDTTTITLIPIQPFSLSNNSTMNNTDYEKLIN